MEILRLDAHDAIELAADPTVAAVAPVMPLRLHAPVGAADSAPPGTPQWGLDAIGALRSSRSGTGPTVAVLDTGIDAGHPCFEGADLVLRNFTVGDDADVDGHGTHCAGVLLGRPYDGRRIGVAPGVTRALIGKVLDATGSSTRTLVAALQWAASNGADIISMSLGIDFPGHVRQGVERGLALPVATSRSLEAYAATLDLFRALVDLLDAGDPTGHGPPLVVAAAGNESDRRSSPQVLLGVTPPARARGMVAVGAIEAVGGGYRPASFSNIGVALAGPGVGIGSAAPGGGLRTLSGTSMATPHVAGVAALWWEELAARRPGTPPTSLELHAHLVTHASTTGFGRGVSPADIGSGLVQAPA